MHMDYKGILKSIKTKDIIYKMLKQANPANVEAFEILKTTRFNRFHNILRQSIKEAKQIYNLQSFEKFKHDIKQTWSIIADTLHRKKKKSLLRVFSHNGRLLKEPDEIANVFNCYFIDMGPLLANQIYTHHNYKEYLRNPSKNQIALQPIEEYKVIQVTDRLKNKLSKGIDGISNNLIKTAKYVFVKPLTLIINQMLYNNNNSFIIKSGTKQRQLIAKRQYNIKNI